MEGSGGAQTKRLAELGRLLAGAEDYVVLDGEGRHLGHVHHVRYERHADRPDEIVVRRGWPGRRKFVVPFEAIAAVDRRAGTVTLQAGE